MSRARRKRPLGAVVWLAGACTPPLVWLALRAAGTPLDPLAILPAAGLGIFGAAFLLSWASEVAQLDVPPALALIFVAWVAVLPEYAVDVYFAWQAGRDPAYTAFATANMTGGNRLLLGIGWAVPVLASWWRFRRPVVRLPAEGAVEVRFLAAATAYSFVIPIKGTLSLLDTALLFTLFGAYLVAAGRARHVEPEIAGPAELLVRLRPWLRRAVIVALFLFAALTVGTAAEPFAESLIATGRRFGIEEFLLVQWVAPLASESPEFIVAVLFAMRGATAAGVGTMISSEVNQWTLLVGALPVAFALSGGHVRAMPLDGRQQAEIFLTSAQSLFGLVVIANLSISVLEAGMLALLFVLQLLLPNPAARWSFAGIYVGLAIGWLLFNPDARTGLMRMLPRRRRAGIR